MTKTKKKIIALIAHDNKKPLLVKWARAHEKWLSKCEIIATGTTGSRIEEATHLKITKYKSGPLGGDQQIGARIAEAEGSVDLLVFLWDPLEPHSHDVDVKALLRIAVVYNVPMACNLASADLMIGSLDKKL